MLSLLSKNRGRCPFLLRLFDLVKPAIYLKIILLTTTRICITQSHQFCVFSLYVIYLPFIIWEFCIKQFFEKKINFKIGICKLMQSSCQCYLLNRYANEYEELPKLIMPSFISSVTN